jgi:hypothetical protein
MLYVIWLLLCMHGKVSLLIIGCMSLVEASSVCLLCVVRCGWCLNTLYMVVSAVAC